MKINAQQKALVKIYLILFVFIYLMINWDNVSWMFNYRQVSGLIHGFFYPYQESELLADTKANRMPALASAAPQSGVKFPYSEKSNVLQIPKLHLEAPVVINPAPDKESVAKALDKGAVYYPGSVMPPASGEIVILGHSAPPNWPKVKYDWIFSNLNSLNPGDEIILHFNHAKYTYKVTEKSIVKAGQEITVSNPGKQENILILVSCWPPGKLYQRIAVQSRLTKNY